MWLFLKALFKRRKGKKNRNSAKKPHQSKTYSQEDQATSTPGSVIPQKDLPQNEASSLDKKPSDTAEREKLIQKAMGLHREQQKMLDSLTGEQRQKLSLLAHFFLFRDPPKDGG